MNPVHHTWPRDFNKDHYSVFSQAIVLMAQKLQDTAKKFSHPLAPWPDTDRELYQICLQEIEQKLIDKIHNILIYETPLNEESLKLIEHHRRQLLHAKQIRIRLENSK